MSVSSLEWVSDVANDPGPDIISLTRSQSPLSLGLYLHTVTFITGRLDNFDPPNYVPFELIIPGNISSDDVIMLNEVISAKYDVNATVEYYFQAGCSIITAYTDLGPLYITPDDRRHKELQDCKVLLHVTSEPVDFLIKSRLAMFLPEQVKTCHDVALVPRNMTRDERDVILEEMESLESNGWIVVKLDSNLVPLVEELSQLWPLQVGKYNEKYMLVKSEMDLGMSLGRWLTQAIVDIQDGKLPLVNYFPLNPSSATVKYDGPLALSLYRNLNAELREDAEYLGSTPSMSLPTTIELRMPSYDDFNVWRKSVSLGKEIGPDLRDQPFPVLPGKIITTDDTLEVELDDRYLIFPQTDPDDWRNGNLLNKYSRVHWRKTGKLSILVT